MHHTTTAHDVSQCALYTRHRKSQGRLEPCGEERSQSSLTEVCMSGGPTLWGPVEWEIRLYSPVPSAPAACLLSGSGDRCG